ncbi:MAG: LysM peptidoglycan-binding domain-containing protein [Lachnospiraceae bacterium]|nr:LysM peptidoglycan-binding domain-containing protein [Lachnospiraceae bacterium]
MSNKGTREYIVEAGYDSGIQNENQGNHNKNHNRTEKLRRMRRAKRMQMLRRKYMMCAFTLVLIICAAISTHAFNAKAKSGVTGQTLYKYYKNIEVQPKDTLWSLATENYCAEKQTLQEYITEVQNINHLNDEQIIVGNHIVLPYYSPEFIYY